MCQIIRHFQKIHVFISLDRTTVSIPMSRWKNPAYTPGSGHAVLVPCFCAPYELWNRYCVSNSNKLWRWQPKNEIKFTTFEECRNFGFVVTLCYKLCEPISRAKCIAAGDVKKAARYKAKSKARHCKAKAKDSGFKAKARAKKFALRQGQGRGLTSLTGVVICKLNVLVSACHHLHMNHYKAVYCLLQKI